MGVMTGGKDLADESNETVKIDSLESYLKMRGWIYNHIPQSNEMEYSTMEKSAFIALQLRMISHILSYPLTIGFYFMEIARLGLLSLPNANSYSERSYNICIIGARAEATLPIEFWKELLWYVNN